MANALTQFNDRSHSRCSFCGKPQNEVRKLIAGPDAAICDFCIDRCNAIILEELPDDRATPGKTPAGPDGAEGKGGVARPPLVIDWEASFFRSGAMRSPGSGISADAAAPPSRQQALAQQWEREYAKGNERENLKMRSRRTKRALYPDAVVSRDATLAHVGFPGVPPFTRGIYPSMYRDRLWTMRQYAGMASPEESNKRYRYLLEQGQTGLSVAFDLPTQLGMDPDEPLALGEVGRVGVPVPTLDDFDRVFEGIPLDRVSISMTINATAIILLSMLVALARRRGTPAEKLSGTVQNDILKEYIARGTYIYPLEASMRLVTDTIAYATEHLPRFNPISISGYHIREAGATAVQELAYTFGNAIAYVDACLARGLSVDRFARRLSFFFNAHSDFCEEVAKFRAARRIWCGLMQNRYHVTSGEALRLRFHTQTSGATLTAQEPMNNVVRVTLQALSAVLGGTQSLHTNALDEALALPTPLSAQLALRTQQIIAHESGVADTIDPLGGSWAVEALTEEIEAEVLTELRKIEVRGGMIHSIADGYVSRAIQESAYVEQCEIDAKKRIVVGVNAYAGGTTPTGIPVQKIDPAVEQGVRARLAEHRARRDAAKVRVALDTVGTVAHTDANLVEPIVAALLAGATLGEIAHALRSVMGEYKDSGGVAR